MPILCPRKDHAMGLFSALTDLVAMPIRLAVDVVKFIPDVANGEVPGQATRDGLKKIEEDLND